MHCMLQPIPTLQKFPKCHQFYKKLRDNFLLAHQTHLSLSLKNCQLHLDQLLHEELLTLNLMDVYIVQKHHILKHHQECQPHWLMHLFVRSKMQKELVRLFAILLWLCMPYRQHQHYQSFVYHF